MIKTDSNLPFVCLNGKLLLEEEACLPVTDRGFLFGDGVFTTLRVSDGKPEFFNLHLARLEQQCLALKITPPLISFDDIENLILLNQATEGIWRLKIIITAQEWSQSQRPHSQLLLTVHPYHLAPFTPSRLCLYPEAVHRPVARLKTLAYLDRLYILDFAQQHHYDDALVVTSEGYLLETAFSNLFWVDDGQFYTPAPSLPYLQGIILNRLKATLSFKEATFCLHDIPPTAQVFTCNSLTHLRPVIQITDQCYSRDHAVEEFLSKKL